MNEKFEDGLNSTETENSAKLRNVSYDEVYELFDNYCRFLDDDDNRIDLGNGVYVQITISSFSFWGLGIETSDGNFQQTIDDFGRTMATLLAGEDGDYIDILTHALNEYIDYANSTKKVDAA